MSGRLSGRRVIVTRAAERAGALAGLLRAEGAEVVEIPVTTTVEPSDGGGALRDAVRRIDEFDWVVVTSPEGARRLLDALSHGGRTRADIGAKVAAVGRSTAQAVGGADLVPTTQTGESLGRVFPSGNGRVLLAVAESAGTDVESSVRDKGWSVERVHSYRTIPVVPASDARDIVADCDVITFTASSSVQAWVAAFGPVTPPLVVAMGPRTADSLRGAGIDTFVVASEQTLESVVRAAESHVGRESPPPEPHR